MSDSPKPLTYAEAGVDIDVGNRLVDRIKPMARATRRAGADAELGGFGGLFDLKAAGFVDPILVAANDGVGTKVKIAIESGIYDTIGIDLVAMCVNDIVVQGAEPLLFLDYFASGKLDEDVVAAVVKGIAEGCAQSGCALIGGETAEMPGLYAAGDFDLAGFAVGAAERGTLLPRGGLKAGDAVLRSAFVRPAFQWFFAGAARRGALRARVGRAGAVRPVAFARGRVVDADAAIRAAAAPGSVADAKHLGSRPCDRRRLSRQFAARARPSTSPFRSISALLRRRRSFLGWRRQVGSRKTKCCAHSTADLEWRSSSPPSGKMRRKTRSNAPGCRRL